MYILLGVLVLPYMQLAIVYSSGLMLIPVKMNKEGSDFPPKLHITETASGMIGQLNVRAHTISTVCL